MGNNLIGWQVLEWLKHHNEEIVGLVLHPKGQQKYGNEILESSGLSNNCVFYADQLRDENTLAYIESLRPDIGLSIFFWLHYQKKLDKHSPKGLHKFAPSVVAT